MRKYIVKSPSGLRYPILAESSTGAKLIVMVLKESNSYTLEQYQIDLTNKSINPSHKLKVKLKFELN